MQIKTLSPKQREILGFIKSEDYALICDGSVRSGKTTVMTLAFLLWAMKNFNRTNFAICGKTTQSVERNVLKPLMELEGLPFSLSYKVSTRILTVRCDDLENWVYLFGGKDESSYMLIQGITLAGVLFDEVALMPRSFVEQALSRAISYDNSKYFFNCNPGNPNHYFYQEWIKEPKPNTRHIHFVLEDNPALTKAAIDRTKAMYSGVFYDRYIRGLWVAAEGLVYQYFANHTEEFLIDDPIEWCRDHKKRFTCIMLGVDFGGTRSFTSFKAVGIANAGVVVVLDEEHINSNDLDPDRLNTRFAEFVTRVQANYGESQTRADNEESVLIRGLMHTAQKNRLRTTVKNAIKMPINDRIRLTLLLMAQKRLYIAKKCVHMISAFQTAVYDSDKFEDVRLDDGTSDIDSLDAFEYAIEPWYKQLEAAGFGR